MKDPSSQTQLLGMRLFAMASLIYLLGLTGCGSEPQSNDSAKTGVAAAVSDGQPRRGGRVVIGLQQEPERLNEILSATATNNLIGNLIFSRFVKYDDQLQLIPDLIETIPTVDNGGISSDHLTYTYTLVAGARWHDGTPLTSADVKFTYDVIMHPEVNAESREGWDAIESVETPDSRTVVFRLKHTFPDFVSETFFDEPVLPRHLLLAELGAPFNISKFHHQPVGSGPFVLDEWVPGSHIVVKRNDDYYGEGPYLDEIVLKFIPDENTLLVQLKTGEIDIYDNADVSFLDQLKVVPGTVVHLTPTMMYEHIDFNLENEILKDKRIRQALVHATDKKTISELVYGGLVEIAHLDEYPTSKYYNEEAASRRVFNPLEARRLLRSAGWVDEDGDGILEKNGRKLSLRISTTAGRINREQTQLVLQRQYRDVGVDLQIRNHNSTVLYGSYEENGILKRGKFDLALYAWLSSPEPATKEDLYSTNTIPPKGQNHPRIRHEELTGLLAEGANEIDDARRVAVYHAITDILVEEAPVIPLFWYTAVDVCSERLKNYRPNPTQSSDTWNAHTWYLTDQSPPPRG
ncbi:MAG: peptide ABC transporter substrate-binding protein [Candidatus Latescibacterota bacterium]|nr:MAG: peptide ABC transporter substrate-binding protein [Candidatus Latescibacterota bacterium]